MANNIFEKLRQGVKTTFGIKDLTPQQKEEQEKRRIEEQAYKQSISEREKQVWQEAYKRELIKQRQLYVQQKDKETMARAMSKAQQEVQVMTKPKERFAWLSAPAQFLQRTMPAPSPKIQRQLDLSLGTLAPNRKAGTSSITPTSSISALGSEAWDIPMGQPQVPMSAQAMEHKLKQHHKHKHHLQHLGTARGGVSVVVNGTTITLSKPNTASSRVRHLKHKLHLKRKLNLKPQSKQTNQFDEMVWKL